MAISTRFSVAVHILTLVYLNRDKQITSDFIAESVGTNPVVIRRIMSRLKKAGLLHSKPGIGGTYLAREPDDMTLYEIYEAALGSQTIFDIHQNPNPNCFVGANIQDTLNETFQTAQQKMENELKQVTLANIIAEMTTKASQN
ncbi:MULTISPECIES: Rrf2 family transcriptional regulator [Listeria]|uniref:Rrf2 family transcriptional regulator n=1 Tax=Listeria TaxID=1637 RepID=UPI000B589B8E|nr:MULTISPECIES: Rrf2 family transcriptional regulator [Listeria]